MIPKTNQCLRESHPWPEKRMLPLPSNRCFHYTVFGSFSEDDIMPFLPRSLHILWSTRYGVARARILKHLMEAEKSTFWGELSFQRSECTARFTLATIFMLCFKDFFVLTVWKNKKFGKMTPHLRFKLKISVGIFDSLELTLSAQPSFENL